MEKFLIQGGFIDMIAEIQKALKAISEADSILIGASNGLSIAEGYNIFADNEMFKNQFGDYRTRYNLKNVLDGIFSKSMTAADYRDFMVRLVKLWVEEYEPTEVMKNLYKLVGRKDYFVLTSNGDEHLEASGFEASKIWEIEGTFRSMRDGFMPIDRQKELNDFLSKYDGKKIVIMELGIGSRNRLIKMPLMQLAFKRQQSTYITLNLPHEIYIPEEISSKSIALPGDIAQTLAQMISYEK